MQDLAALTDLFFPQQTDLGEFCAVEAEDMPEAYRRLLAHDQHMTESVEAFHHGPIDVQVVQQRLDGDMYARTSLLLTRDRREPVQLGVMQINVAGLPDATRAAIFAGKTPLGRLLVSHNVLRRVELIQLYRVNPGPKLRLHLKLPAELPPSRASQEAESPPIYGRTARILVGGRAAVSLLEIVTA